MCWVGVNGSAIVDGCAITDGRDITGAMRLFADAQLIPIGSPQFLVLYRTSFLSSLLISVLIYTCHVNYFLLNVLGHPIYSPAVASRTTSVGSLTNLWIWMRCFDAPPPCCHYFRLNATPGHVGSRKRRYGSGYPYCRLRVQITREGIETPHGRCGSLSTLGARNTKGLRKKKGFTGVTEMDHAMDSNDI